MAPRSIRKNFARAAIIPHQGVQAGAQGVCPERARARKDRSTTCGRPPACGETLIPIPLACRERAQNHPPPAPGAPVKVGETEVGGSAPWKRSY